MIYKTNILRKTFPREIYLLIVSFLKHPNAGIIDSKRREFFEELEKCSTYEQRVLRDYEDSLLPILHVQGSLWYRYVLVHVRKGLFKIATYYDDDQVIVCIERSKYDKKKSFFAGEHYAFIFANISEPKPWFTYIADV